MFDVYQTELKQGLYKPKPGIHINPEKNTEPLTTVKEADLKNTVDLTAPRMTADNAKKAVVAPKVEVKVVEAVKEAKAADADAAADAKKPVKKSE